MISSNIKYSCKYYSVGFFVFIESNNSDSTKQFSIEPIMEVDTEEQGIELINWLSDNHFVARQIANMANDNY